MIRIKKQLYMIEEMSFKCLLDVFWPMLPREVFRNPIKSLWWSNFCEHSNDFQPLIILQKKAPSQMFRWVLNRPWQYLRHIQDAVKNLWWSVFVKIVNNFQLLTIFAKILHHRQTVGNISELYLGCIKSVMERSYKKQLTTCYFR